MDTRAPGAVRSGAAEPGAMARFLQEVQTEGQRSDMKDARAEIDASKRRSEASRSRIAAKERDVDADQEALRRHQEEGPGWFEKHLEIGNHGGRTKELEGSIDAHNAEIESEEVELRRERDELEEELSRIKEGFDVARATAEQLASMLDANHERTSRVVRG